MDFNYWKEKAASETKIEQEDFLNTAAAADESKLDEEQENAVMQALENELRNDAIEAIENKQSDEKNDSNIVDLSQVRKVKEEEEAKEQLEIDEFFEKEEKKLTTGKVFKYIFVDGLLGIPLLTVFDLITGCFIALFAAIAILLLGSSLAVMAAALFTIALGAVNVISIPVSGIYLFGTALLTAAVSLILLLISVFFAVKAIPFAAKVAGRFEKKLNLFGRRA